MLASNSNTFPSIKSCFSFRVMLAMSTARMDIRFASLRALVPYLGSLWVREALRSEDGVLTSISWESLMF